MSDEHVFDRQKWQSLTIFEQMGNIGSEVGRAFAARRRGDTAAMTGAWQRGLDLLDATAEQLARQNRQNSAKSYAPANYSPAWKTNRWKATLCGLWWRRGETSRCNDMFFPHVKVSFVFTPLYLICYNNDTRLLF